MKIELEPEQIERVVREEMKYLLAQKDKDLFKSVFEDEDEYLNLIMGAEAILDWYGHDE